MPVQIHTSKLHDCMDGARTGVMIMVADVILSRYVCEADGIKVIELQSPGHVHD